jgi:hypothetical protein
MKISNIFISLRKPQVTSMATAIVFNRPVIEALLTKYSETIKNTTSVLKSFIKADMSGFSTVHKPTKAVAVKGSKRIGSDIWRKRRRSHHRRRNEAETLH